MYTPKREMYALYLPQLDRYVSPEFKLSDFPDRTYKGKSYLKGIIRRYKLICEDYIKGSDRYYTTFLDDLYVAINPDCELVSRYPEVPYYPCEVTYTEEGKEKLKAFLKKLKYEIVMVGFG